MVLTRLSHAGGACPLGKDKEDDCFECSSEGGGAQPGRSIFQKPLPPRRTAQLHVLDLPVEILEKILSVLSFGEVSRLRIVCQKFNLVSGNMLTKSFHLLQNQTLQRFQAIKAQMPRRESLRRKHPLVTHCDIIETLNMRLTLLQMTFGKHMERKHICFFAGEILDEVIQIMSQLKSQSRLTIRITDELFDLSTMATEYFKEHIERRLPDLLSFGPEEHINYPSSPGPGSTSASSVVDSSVSGDWDVWDDDDDFMVNSALKKKIGRMSKQLKKSTAQLASVKKEMRSYKARVEEQSRTIAEYTARLDDHDKKFDESARKFTTVLQELNECKTELQYWRSRSAQGSDCCQTAPGAPAPLEELASPPSPGAPLAAEAAADAPLKSPQRWDALPTADDEPRHSDESETEGENKMETRSKRKTMDGDELRRARTLKPRKRAKN
ncbi:F-box only protein 28-like [Pollicipes pollicipes]|uniref:F-box only protein 28-like n=1 Tax=Pollicipes pollicipes TaxID=41117 RepID=UPI0018853E31|nr:F-box only protein 28-like [Pollicipes pollicipes]